MIISVEDLNIIFNDSIKIIRIDVKLFKCNNDYLIKLNSKYYFKKRNIKIIELK